MAKVTKVFNAELRLNPEKGGGWLAEIRKSDVAEISAWKNASAGKKWIKAKVLEHTPRKSVKMVATKTDANQKPTQFEGELSWKE